MIATFESDLYISLCSKSSILPATGHECRPLCCHDIWNRLFQFVFAFPLQGWVCSVHFVGSTVHNMRRFQRPELWWCSRHREILWRLGMWKSEFSQHLSIVKASQPHRESNFQDLECRPFLVCMKLKSEILQYLSIAKASQPPGENDYPRHFEETWNISPFGFSWHSNASFCSICR